MLLKNLSIFSMLAILSINTYAVDSNTQISREYILNQKDVPVYTYKIVTQYPHGNDNFTEGLVKDDDYLYEGTGRYGKSAIYKTNIKTGKVIREAKLDDLHFGEGITLLGNNIYQITYTSNDGFIYDKDSLKQVGTFEYPSQGWGMTAIDGKLVLSDGSSVVKYIDPKNFKITKTIHVKDKRSSIGSLNALLYVDGTLYANVWQTNIIAMINPDNGSIKGWIDLTNLNPDTAVYAYPYLLNGITYNPKTNNLIVTGKCWPYLYEIKLQKI